MSPMSWVQVFPDGGQQVQKQKVDEDSVALGQVARQSDPAAFLAADQDLLGQHQLPDVLEADGTFMTHEPEFLRDSRNDLALGKRSDNRATPALVAIDVKQEQRKNLEGVQESSRLIDDAEAIGIAVRRQSDVAPAWPRRARPAVPVAASSVRD